MNIEQKNSIWVVIENLVGVRRPMASTAVILGYRGDAHTHGGENVGAGNKFHQQ